MKQFQIKIVLVLAVVVFAAMKASAQSAMPDVLVKNPLKEQLKYLQERTLIYENYRAIREDMFQKVKGNVVDTLNALNGRIASLKKVSSELKSSLDSLGTNLESIKANLAEMTRTKNSIKVIGIEVNKNTYNSFMWTILAGLVLLLIIGFLIFKRNLFMIANTKKEYQDLKNELEAYRKTSREAREKLIMDHFNEIKRLKGGG